MDYLSWIMVLSSGRRASAIAVINDAHNLVSCRGAIQHRAEPLRGSTKEVVANISVQENASGMELCAILTTSKNDWRADREGRIPLLTSYTDDNTFISAGTVSRRTQMASWPLRNTSY